MFQIVILAAALAFVNAGIIGAPAVATYSAAPSVSSSYFHQASAPVAVAHAAPLAAPVLSTYAAAPVAIHAPAVGATQQSVARSLGGAQSISQYSKAEDSAFSSVRKYDTRITNDAFRVAHSPVFSTYSAPAPTYFQQAAPAPLISTYSSAPVITKTVAPVAAYTAHAPVAAAYTAHSPVATYTAHAPVAYSAGPVVAKAALAYSPATVVSHMTFSGLGTSYQW